jgi:hypothetical protein
MTDLPERLRNAAAAHRPDRERMLARVEHAMARDGAGSAEPESHARGHDRPAPWVRVTAVTAAVAGAIGLGGLAAGAVINNSGGPGPSTSVTSGGTDSARPAPSESGSSGTADGRVPMQRHSQSPPKHHKGADKPTTPGRDTPSSPPLQAPPPSVPGSNPATPTGADSATGVPQSSGPLQSDGVVDSSSDDFFEQNNVVLTTRQELTSLTVELRIAVVHGETYHQAWTTASQTQVQTSTEGGFIVYRWTLTSGQTIPPGSYTFAGQFTHDKGEGGTDGDNYTVTAGFASGSPVTVAGHF